MIASSNDNIRRWLFNSLLVNEDKKAKATYENSQESAPEAKERLKEEILKR